MSEPLRSCIGCRKVEPKSKLLRLTVKGIDVVEAAPGLSGRGAYLHWAMSCMRQASEAKRLERAFRQKGLRLALSQGTIRRAMDAGGTGERDDG